ncbi:ABC transporter ATP-binding protein [Curtobacterium citreum]|uniref:ABC transporter ATP-binding protein n=1 Tax=Curtobacterium citreum TaxID=2036 RepID=UPI00254363DA|nr:ATP-binding cassette domain-containing protein [Curtobacterium citreum]WIJ46263.1 ATP-binding cassette domain-containing protein [Curtobacterium citreum]
MAAADDDDVYVTSDAAWMTEVDDAEGDATDDDLGDGDARDASAGDGMTDDTTTTVSDPAVTEPATASTIAASTTAAGPSPASRPAPRKGKGRGRVTRPVQTAAVRDDAAAVRDATTASAQPEASEQSSAAPTATDDAGTTAAQKKKRVPKRQPAARETPAATKTPQQPVVLRATGLVKRYGQTLAADEVDLEIRQGSIFGVVGPNGAGKTTTLSMITGLLRPDAGTVSVLDHDVWSDPTAAKRDLGVLPDRLRLFDRLTGAQLLHYSATLRGLDGATARQRSADLAQAFGLGEALGRQVADYSVGMAKKIALAATLIHSPRVLVLDEPFESVDPVSAATITEILRRYTRGGGTVVLSSHSMELVQRTCDSVAIIVGGKVLASGTMAQVRGRRSLEDKFVELAGGRVVAESMEWLHSFSD